MQMRTAALVTTGAAIAIAGWLWLAPHGATPAQPAFAPVTRDYALRDRIIAFEERAVRAHPADQITRRMLAAQYLMRFREQGDVGDIQRAQEMAQLSIRLQPQGNTQAQMALAAALLTYHNFRGALVHEDAAIAGEPFNNNAWAQKASLLMELGRYAEAKRILSRPITGPENPTWESVKARYDELTGNLGEARALLMRCERLADGMVLMPAYDRSYYHFRSAQLAFEAGDYTDSEREFKTALQIYPYNSMALMFEARLFRAERRWHHTLAAATASAKLYPLPQALGYKADAQRALGMKAAAARTDALILAEQRLFNVQGINDRLIANYFAQRRTHLADALQDARADYAQRGNEIYADDTMSWVLAALGRWTQARAYSLEATRFNTQDPVLQYHAAIIALHTGHRAEGLTRLRAALRMGSEFSPIYPQIARRLLRQHAAIAGGSRGRAASSVASFRTVPAL